MSLSKIHCRSTLQLGLLSTLCGAALLSACGTDPAGLQGSANAGAAGSSQPAQGGSDETPTAGGSQASAGDTQADDAQAGAAGDAQSVSTGGGSATGGSGDSANGGSGGADESGKGGSHGGVKIGPTCTFHTNAIVSMGGADAAGGAPNVGGAPGVGGSGGSGGAAGPQPTIALQVNAFVGKYLTDSAGRTLYTYGVDLPGDCHTPPVSLCITSCLVSWPSFPAGARVLGAGLDDGAFGAIQRADDGTWQTTYYGWPLYYYKTDLTIGQFSGQAKGKTWHVAQQKPPGVVIMQTGMLKYLGDASGRTLYVSAADQVAQADTDPVSTCSGSCLDTFEPFHEKNFSVVTSLSAADFGAFVAAGASLQVAYKGMPLYRAATDLKSGDMNGTAITGFTAALP